MSIRILPIRRIEGAPVEMSDEALIAACATGEAAALGALFDRYHDLVRRFLARRSGTDDRDLDDLVQATFVALPSAARSFAARATVKTWLLGVANNVARHHVRTEVRRKQLSAAFAGAPRSDAGDATADVLERERAARLRAALDALPAKLRETFVLVYLEGISGPEAAEMLGVRQGTIWARLHDARAQLRASLGGLA